MRAELKSKHDRCQILYPIGVLFFSWFFYWLPAVLTGHGEPPPFDYFDNLASAFLHGKLYLSDPPIVHDLTFYDGHWYVPFPPLPALLMVPWVWLFGELNTTTFTITIGALNVVLAFATLEALRKQQLTHLKPSDNLWLVIFFGFGTAHWYLSTIGAVWFTSQICTVTFMLLSIWSALTFRSPLWASAALACAMLARPHVVLAYPLLFMCIVARQQNLETTLSRSFFVKTILISISPIILSFGILFTYNYLRFSDALDFGYHTQNVSPELAARLEAHGQFSFRFVSENLHVMLASLPIWSIEKNTIVPDPGGMSLLLTSPAFILLYKARFNSLVKIGAWIATAFILMPLLMYYNTGRDQFGYRFSMDFIVPIILLLALGQRHEITQPTRLLIMISIGMNVWGVLWFHTSMWQ